LRSPREAIVVDGDDAAHPELTTGMNVDSRHEPGKMIYQPRQKKHVAKEQPVGDAMIGHGPNAGI